MFWTSADQKTLKRLETQLTTLLDQQETCKERQNSLKADLTHIDADMSALWDKVAHALARLGGRKSVRKQPQDDNGQSDQISLDELNRRIMDGEIVT